MFPQSGAESAKKYRLAAGVDGKHTRDNKSGRNGRGERVERGWRESIFHRLHPASTPYHDGRLQRSSQIDRVQARKWHDANTEEERLGNTVAARRDKRRGHVRRGWIPVPGLERYASRSSVADRRYPLAFPSMEMKKREIKARAPEKLGCRGWAGCPFRAAGVFTRECGRCGASRMTPR